MTSCRSRHAQSQNSLILPRSSRQILQRTHPCSLCDPITVSGKTSVQKGAETILQRTVCRSGAERISCLFLAFPLLNFRLSGRVTTFGKLKHTETHSAVDSYHCKKLSHCLQSSDWFHSIDNNTHIQKIS